MLWESAAAVKSYKARVVEVFDGQAASNDPDPMQDAVGAALLRYADLKKGEAVLDIGTGNGSLARAAANAVGPLGSVVALELSPQQAKLAQSQSAAAVASGGCSIFVMLADAEKVQLRAESYNAILCCSTLAYMSDIQAALAKWKTWLKPSGRLMFTCFQAPYDPETRLFYELAVKFGFTGVIDPLLPIGSEQQIRDLLSSAGYSNIGVEHKPLEPLTMPTPTAAAARYTRCPTAISQLVSLVAGFIKVTTHTTIPAASVDWYLKYMWDVSCSCPAHTLPLLSWKSWPESETDTHATPTLMKALSQASGGGEAKSAAGKVVTPAAASVGGGGGPKAAVDLVQLAAFRREFMTRGAELVARRLTKDKKAVENLCTVIYVSARC
ncbi:MAG: hypothetical protein WDW36_000302 [Sanguina aurantia]